MPIMVNTPTWENIPDIMSLSHREFTDKSTPLIEILSVLEAVNVALKTKVQSFMKDGTFTGDQILHFGPILTELDDQLEKAANALILHEDIQECKNELTPVFTVVQNTWNELVKGGYLDEV